MHLCKGEGAVEKHLLRLKGALPSKGSIRCLQITDRQYAHMRILLKITKKTERKGRRSACSALDFQEPFLKKPFQNKLMRSKGLPLKDQ